MSMENILHIEDIVESTLAPHFFINFRVNMVDYVNLHKAVTKRSVCLEFKIKKKKTNKLD